MGVPSTGEAGGLGLELLGGGGAGAATTGGTVGRGAPLEAELGQGQGRTRPLQEEPVGGHCRAGAGVTQQEGEGDGSCRYGGWI